MKKNERKQLPFFNLFQIQTNITPRMRSTIIDWIVEVHMKSRMHTDTLYLTIRLIDLYLSSKDLDKSKFQMLSCAALLIASKNLESTPFSVESLVECAGTSFTSQELIDMEFSLFHCVKYHIDFILPSMFLKRYLRLILPDMSVSMLSYYICETSMLYPEFIGVTPSRLAAASIYLSLIIHGHSSTWDHRISINTGYTTDSLTDLIRKLHRSVISTTTSRFQAIRRKYAGSSMYNVSLIPFQDLSLS